MTVALVHVWKLPTITLCDLVVVAPSAYTIVEPEELRRQIHTRGRANVEPEICPACYAAARPKKSRTTP